MKRSDPLALPVPRRDPSVVMRLARMGSFHQSRLSFMRVLLRRLKSEKWRFERAQFDVNDACEGTCVYTAHGPERSYSLVAFAHDLPAEMRSDRVIATQWDATFTLFDGIPTPGDIARLRANVPLQEAGRITEKELSLSRANRSVRMWDYVVECLAGGGQPDPQRIEDVGYLMRTTAVYGSGKFGAADYTVLRDRPEFSTPFQVEMLNVYLIRAFVMDLVEHAAKVRNGNAVRLSPDLRRKFGIGNSTGLGMAPFLLNHPVLLNNWIMAREEALSRVRSVPYASPQNLSRLQDFVQRAIKNADRWNTEHPIQVDKLKALKGDLTHLCGHVQTTDIQTEYPWNDLWLWGEAELSVEGQEQLCSLLLELYPEFVDDLADTMSADETQGARIDGSMTKTRLRTLIETLYPWALHTDWAGKPSHARVWYVSAEKLEPRLGERFEEDLDPYEQPLGPARDVALLYQALEGEGSVGAFLMRNPGHRHTVRRIQVAAAHPYAEICDNTIAAEMLPIDLLRAKLSFFGARHFDPRSDRWVRINMFQDAPLPDELHVSEADDWTYPAL